ncbi:hypothetical protein E2C01_008531 [Portunus trituberculatus]|uniref:Uncharacterized protein n=1 Tax=Portunus trituberculatus TaxID=210409 RepID=A0A5B7D245_PORTR|nr:hypothetical protein [Portunus trituberculatus]
MQSLGSAFFTVASPATAGRCVCRGEGVISVISTPREATHYAHTPSLPQPPPLSKSPRSLPLAVSRVLRDSASLTIIILGSCHHSLKLRRSLVPLIFSVRGVPGSHTSDFACGCDSIPLPSKQMVL